MARLIMFHPTSNWVEEVAESASEIRGMLAAGPRVVPGGFITVTKPEVDGAYGRPKQSSSINTRYIVEVLP